MRFKKPKIFNVECLLSMLALALIEAPIPERAMPLGWFPMVRLCQDSLGEQ